MVIKSWREIINVVREQFKSLNANSYIYLSDRFLMSELQSSSLKKIKEATDKRKLWGSDNIFTTLPCISLKEVSLSECCSFTSPCTISRSVEQLPRIAEGTNFGYLIKGVWSIDTVSRRFLESDANRYANSLHLKLTTNQIHYWIQDKYLYLSDESIKSIKIAAYFEEDIPELLVHYPSYCGNNITSSCCGADNGKVTSTGGNDMSLCCPKNPLDQEATIPSYMVDDVINMVSDKLNRTYGRVPSTPTDGIVESKK